MRIKMTCFVLCVLCVHTALSQGTIDTSNIRWRLTLQGAETQCGFSHPSPKALGVEICRGFYWGLRRLSGKRDSEFS